MELADFKRVWRGYEPEEVDKAWAELQRNLSEANASNRELRLQINSLREQNSEWEKRSKSCGSMEKDLRDAIVSAQRMANQVREEAERTAQQILEQAKINADSLVSETQLETERKIVELDEQLYSKTQILNELEEKISDLTAQKENLSLRLEKAQAQLLMTRSILEE